jgi:hypothetical protein
MSYVGSRSYATAVVKPPFGGLFFCVIMIT